MKNNQQKTKPVYLVDAICGSGKSHRLIEYILGLQYSSEAIPQRILIAVPTHELATETRNKMLDAGIHGYHVKVDSGAVLALKQTLSESFDYPVVITTHQALQVFCERATFDSEMQKLLSPFQVFIDEIPSAWHGDHATVLHSDAVTDNFPFMQWMKEEEGLLFLKSDNENDLYKYYHERHAGSDSLKAVIYAVLNGSGLLYGETDKGYSFFAQTANPVINCAMWSERLTIMGAGVSRSEWRYVAENVAKVECMPAPDHLLPDNDRREHKNTPVKLVSVLKPGVKATLTQLQEVFNNHLQTIALTMGSRFIFATNNDKGICNFKTIALDSLEDNGKGKAVSMASYGLNVYQSYHAAAFLGCANLNATDNNRWAQWLNFSGYDAEAVLRLKVEAMTYERCYQFISRTSIRDSSCKEALTFIVPDSQCAEYIKRWYLPQAEITTLGIEKERKPYSSDRGKDTKQAIQELKAKGMKQKAIAEALGIDLNTVKYHCRKKK